MWNLYQVMQLFVGYVHLWGFAFMEGCIASVAWLYPDFEARFSNHSDFFVWNTEVLVPEAIQS